MTPAARVAAAIDLLDAILAGQSAEQALTRWARANRFAGSKDRAAIRDHVFDALRCKRSYAWLGGAETGRGLMLGACRAANAEHLFDGSQYGPAPASDDEVGALLDSAPRGVRLDMPDWLLPHVDAALEDPDAAMAQQRHRAGVFLRVNLARCTLTEAMDSLSADAIVTRPVEDIKTALQVVENERRVSQSRAYKEGLVELQDPASQAAVLRLPLRDGMRVLDLCAGGGGKSLAMAALADLEVTAHDIDPRRMKDIASRATRAGVTIRTIAQPTGTYDLVLVDAPCSGSGTWRRSPEAKWALTPERLDDLTHIQDGLLDQARTLLDEGGTLAYATCSIFRAENEERTKAAMMRHDGLKLRDELRLAPAPLHDGFYLSVMNGP